MSKETLAVVYSWSNCDGTFAVGPCSSHLCSLAGLCQTLSRCRRLRVSTARSRRCDLSTLLEAVHSEECGILENSYGIGFGFEGRRLLVEEPIRLSIEYSSALSKIRSSWSLNCIIMTLPDLEIEQGRHGIKSSPDERYFSSFLHSLLF